MRFLRQWLWILPLLILPLSGFFNAPGLAIDPDNLKYMGIAWGMQQSGHYLIPEVNGVLYTDKPPLLFWLIIFCWRFLGVNMVVLQCLISAIIASWIFLTQSTYATLFVEDKAGKALLPYVMVSSLAVLEYCHFLHVDLILVSSVLLVNLGICKYLFPASTASTKNNRAPVIYIAGGIFLGLFAKGPVIYVFTILPCLASMLCAQHDRVSFFKILRAVMIGTGFFFLLWIMPVMLQANHQYLQQIFYKQITDRAGYKDAGYFYYLIKLPFLLIPWSINFLFIRQFSRLVTDLGKKNLFIIMIVIIGILVFSLFGQKRFWYLLPCIPYVIIILTRFFVMQKDNRAVFGLNWVMLFASFLLLSVGGIGIWFSPELQRMALKDIDAEASISSVMVLGFSAASGLMAVYLLIMINKIKLLRLFKVASMGIALLFVIISPYFYMLIENSLQIKKVEEVFARQQNASAEVAQLFDQRPAYTFNYLARMQVIPVLYSTTEMEQWLVQHPRGIVIVHMPECPSPLHLVITSDIQHCLCQKSI